MSPIPPRNREAPHRLTIPADLSRVAEVRAWLGEVAGGRLPEARLFDLQVTVSEAAANAIEHAASAVELTAWLLPDRLMVEITNDGIFQPGLYKDDEHRRRGLGLPLMVSLADQVHVFRQPQGKTTVSLTFFLQRHRRQISGPDSAGGREIVADDVENLYRNLVELSPDAIIVHIDGMYVFANPAAARLFGASSPDELIGMKAIERLHPDDRELMVRRVSQALAGGVAPPVEGRMLRLDGTPISVDSTGSRVEFGGSLAIQVIIRDITERKRAEKALSESEERFRTMADAIPQLAWMADPDGYIYWYNRRWYEYTGTTPAEMEGWGWQSVHDAKELPRVLERWRQSIATGQPFDMEFPLRGADGIFRAFLTRVMPLKDGDGRVLQWFGTNTDIAERKRAEEEAEEQRHLLLTAQEDYRLLFSEMLDGLAVHEIILDERGEPCDYRFVAVNPAFERLTGLCATDIVGKTVLEVIPDLELSWIERYGRVALTGEQAHFESHAAALGRHYEVTAYRPREGRFATIFHDVTARKRAEQTLLRLNRTLAATAPAIRLSLGPRTSRATWQRSVGSSSRIAVMPWSGSATKKMTTIRAFGRSPAPVLRKATSRRSKSPGQMANVGVGRPEQRSVPEDLLRVEICSPTRPLRPGEMRPSGVGTPRPLLFLFFGTGPRLAPS